MSSKTDWRVDQSGLLCDFSVHDANLADLSVSPKREVVLLLQGQSDSRVFTRIVLSTIHELNVMLYQGITVSRIYIWRVDAVPLENWSVPDLGWNALFAGPYGPKDARQESERIASLKPGALLFQLDSSYGGGIVAVCDRISISEDVPESVMAV